MRAVPFRAIWRNIRCVVRFSTAAKRAVQGRPSAITCSPEVALNQRVKNLIQKLGEAIHESVSESENIAGVVKNIREQGFDVLLMLEATIGLNEVEDEGVEAATSGSNAEQVEGPFSRNDLNFLKSLRISLPDIATEGAPGSRPALPSSTSDSNTLGDSFAG